MTRSTTMAAGVVLLGIVAVPSSNVCLAGGATALDARLGEAGGSTRFVLELSAATSYNVRLVGHPPRVVIDLANVDFNLSPHLGRVGGGAVSEFRYGLVAPGQSRIVLDLKAPVSIANVFVLKGKTSPLRLVVDLAPAGNKPRQRRYHGGDIRPPVPAHAAAVAIGTAWAPLRRPLRSSVPLIVIDPGHGGVDPGAISLSGQREKDIVLKFARRLSATLKKMGGVRVRMTRANDIFVPLRQRVEFARRLRADLFLSLHADSVAKATRKTASGATIYTLSRKGSDSDARAMAARENRSDIVAGFDAWENEPTVSAILISLAKEQSKQGSRRFAKGLLAALRGRVRLNRRPHRTANFHVLRTRGIDAALLELGYVSNNSDLRNLNSRRWQKRAAIHVACALLEHVEARTAVGYHCKQ